MLPPGSGGARQRPARVMEPRSPGPEVRAGRPGPGRGPVPPSPMGTWAGVRDLKSPRDQVPRKASQQEPVSASPRRTAPPPGSRSPGGLEDQGLQGSGHRLLEPGAGLPRGRQSLPDQDRHPRPASRSGRPRGSRPGPGRGPVPGAPGASIPGRPPRPRSPLPLLAVLQAQAGDGGHGRRRGVPGPTFGGRPGPRSPVRLGHHPIGRDRREDLRDRQRDCGPGQERRGAPPGVPGRPVPSGRGRERRCATRRKRLPSTAITSPPQRVPSGP
jgi:translation initiation factor IF-2